MAEDEHPIWKTLEGDAHNVGESRKLLESHGLMALFEEINTLFNSLPREVEAGLQDSKRDVYTRENSSGEAVPAWDFILRTYLVQSAGMQFLYAVGHLLRGHSFEIFGHARTIIESAGIAYLSKTEPDLGDLYLHSSDQSYRNRTGSSKILPKNDPLTRDLRGTFDCASEVFHANFSSVAGRIKTEFTVAKGKRDFRNEMMFHDVDGRKPELFFGHAVWLIRLSARVLRLFASAFSLPDCVWYRRLEQFEGSLDSCFSRLQSTVDFTKITT